MKVDVSDYAMGRVLSMKYENRQWRLVVYLSKSLNKTERNYEVYDKEILVVIRDLENRRYLLEDNKYKSKI